MLERSLYHQPKAEDRLARLRKRYRDVTIDDEGTTRRVLTTQQGMFDELGNPLSARVDYRGRLLDVLENRYYYDM